VFSIQTHFGVFGEYFGRKGFFSAMKLSFTKFEDYCIIDLQKNVFEKENIEKLKSLIEKLTEEGCKTFLLNMGQLSKINDTGLSMLLGLYKFSFYHEISIRLYNLQSYVSQIIYQTRLNIIFDICTADDELFKTDKSDIKMVA